MWRAEEYTQIKISKKSVKRADNYRFEKYPINYFAKKGRKLATYLYIQTLPVTFQIQSPLGGSEKGDL